MSLAPGSLVSPVTYTSGQGRSLPLFDREEAQDRDLGTSDRYLEPGSLAFVVGLSATGSQALLLGPDMRLGWASCRELYRWTGRSRG